jgi:hypothetical protein
MLSEICLPVWGVRHLMQKPRRIKICSSSSKYSVSPRSDAQPQAFNISADVKRKLMRLPICLKESSSLEGGRRRLHRVSVFYFISDVPVNSCDKNIFSDTNHS